MTETLRRLSEVDVPPDGERLLTGVAGLDACLAESDESPPGLPLGCSILLSGMPGGGKSTLATYMADAAGECLILYGDEREASLRKRWTRLGLGKKGCDPFVARITSSDAAMELIRDLSPRITVVDSIQTMSHNGSRKYDAQAEGAEMIARTCETQGNSVVFVCHVDKSGTKHAGAQSLAHFVDVHLHVSVNSKKNERALEIRKNRLGRGGFQVPINVTGNLLTVGTPAPITGDGSVGSMKSRIEQIQDVCKELLMKGEPLNGYDMDRMPGDPKPAGGIWRLGLEMAHKALARDGIKIISEKVGGRMTHRVAPEHIAKPEPSEAPSLEGPSFEAPASISSLIELS